MIKTKAYNRKNLYHPFRAEPTTLYPRPGEAVKEGGGGGGGGVGWWTVVVAEIGDLFSDEGVIIGIIMLIFRPSHSSCEISIHYW